MTVYSFYIFDRHTECIYHRSWLPASSSNPSATPFTSIPASTSTTTAVPPSTTSSSTATTNNPSSTNNVTAPKKGGPPPPQQSRGGGGSGTTTRNAATDNAKLVFGTVFSLRNMVRKLGGDDDAFVCFRTGEYKLHYYETPSNLRMAMLTDTGTMSMRNVLHQIYINLWVEYVTKNPLSPVEHKGGEGVKNELFELGLDQFVRSLG